MGTRSAITEGGSVWWGSKTELEQIGFPANETVGRDAGNVSTRFLSKSVVGEKSSVRKRWGGSEENRLRGEESPD